MLFEKPEVLYFLFLLLIPLIVHLFQLRKFKTTRFSNVALLQRIQALSRKSSRLKKWLILMTRLLSLVFLVLAFAKPFIPSSKTALQENEIVIYLDNSFSMELPGQQMTLLEEAKQNLWSSLQSNQEFTLFTNDNTWKNVTKSDIKKEFFSIEFAAVHLNFENLLLKAQSLFKTKESSHRLFIISDALNFEEDVNLKPEKGMDLHLIIKRPTSLKNYSIASANLQSKNSKESIKVNLQSYQQTEDDITVALYADEDLIAKTKANFEKSTTSQVEFGLSNANITRGRIQLEPDGMSYDNTLYFSQNKNSKIKVIRLHSEANNSSFLSSIYQPDLFDYQSYDLDNFDYERLAEAQLIIVDEVRELNPILLSRLKGALSNGKQVLIIPAVDMSMPAFRELLQLRMYSSPTERESKVTTINFDHPIFENVFSEKIKSFDYPSTAFYYGLHSNFTPILSFSNGQAFLGEYNKVFCFASPLNTEVSNFINSPLVVPIFYNIALQSSPSPQLYSTVGEQNLINIQTKLGKDEVLRLSNKDTRLIPQQTKMGNAVQINTQYHPQESGYYQLIQQDSILMHLSFNYNRTESDLNPLDINDLEVKRFASIPEAFNSFTEEHKILELWKWMLIFALGFFLVELLILRFLN